MIELEPNPNHDIELPKIWLPPGSARNEYLRRKIEPLDSLIVDAYSKAFGSWEGLDITDIARRAARLDGLQEARMALIGKPLELYIQEGEIYADGKNTSVTLSEQNTNSKV